MTGRPQLVMLAGPNGAGKTTFYERHLAHLALPFLNADLLAAKTGIDSFEAARTLDAERIFLVERRQGFITETVFSDPIGEKLELLRRAVAAGFDVRLLYIGLEPALAPLRIDDRVAAGGHDVPRDKLVPRFERSLANLREALTFMPVVRIYDNSALTAPHRLIAIYEAGKRTYLADGPLPGWLRGVLPPPTRRRTKKLVS